MNLKPIAQDHAWERLLQYNEKLPPSLILVGPAGVGKKRTAKAFFQWIHCTARSDSPCGTCISCKKIYQGFHTDYLEISPQSNQIVLEDIEVIKTMLPFAPLEGRVRFIVINDAHCLNIATANSLLKILEEPPPHTRFFLITHERGLMIPTILSRSQFIHFKPLSEQILTSLLKEQNITLPPSILPLCLKISEGGLERMQYFTHEKAISFLEFYQNKKDLKTWDEVVKFSEMLANDEQTLELFLNLLIHSLHEEILLTPHKQEKFKLSNRALEVAYLYNRIKRYANKKLIALAAACLLHTQEVNP